MTWTRNPRPYVTPTPTPIWDRLMSITGGNALATYHGQKGAEWDVLRDVPLRTRRRLTSAGLMARDGEKPDVFCDLLVTYGGGEAERFDGYNPLAWWLREAVRALDERQSAVRKDRRRRLARRHGDRSYYAYRVAWCRERGYPSLWSYRQAMRWTENRH